MSKKLTDRDITLLRENGRVFEHEVPSIEGDIVIAINPVTNTRRIVDTSDLMLESMKRLLLD